LRKKQQNCWFFYLLRANRKIAKALLYRFTTYHVLSLSVLQLKAPLCLFSGRRPYSFEPADGLEGYWVTIDGCSGTLSLLREDKCNQFILHSTPSPGSSFCLVYLKLLRGYHNADRGCFRTKTDGFCRLRSISNFLPLHRHLLSHQLIN
jgi:hypothetical protein